MDMQKSYRVVVGIGSDYSSFSPQKKIVSNQPYLVNCFHHLLFLQSESVENNQLISCNS